MAQQNEFKVGQVLDTIRCKNAPEHSYSLYLPSYYNSQSLWPVIYIYDAAGRGKNSAKIFSQAGEKHGFVIVGSHNFRNGSFDSGVDAIDFLFEDVPKRVSIDVQKTYTAGLSGGARMAAATAVLADGIAGVIGFAAGNHSNFPIPKAATFTWVGVAGNLDMNYSEMVNVKKQLDQFGVKNRFMSYPGPHGWPPDSIISIAVEWMKMMTIDISSKNDEVLLDLFITSKIEKAKRLFQEKQFDQSSRILKTLNAFCFSTRRATEIDSLYKIIVQSSEALEKEKIIDSIQQAEQDWISQINVQLRALENEDPSLNIRALHKLIDRFILAESNEINPLLRNMNNRLLGYIALYTNTKGTPLLFAKSYHKAIIYLELWQATHPNDPGIAYFMSKYYALAGKNVKAQKMYDTSVMLGFPALNIINKKDLREQLKDPKDFRRLRWDVARAWL